MRPSQRQPVTLEKVNQTLTYLASDRSSIRTPEGALIPLQEEARKLVEEAKSRDITADVQALHKRLFAVLRQKK